MYRAATKEFWKGRVDVHDGELGLRWHQAVQLLDLSKGLPEAAPDAVAFAFLGFCSEEGVRRNQGRPGAGGGPAALRAAMASFAYHLHGSVQLYDAGDVLCSGGNLEEAQEQLGKKVALLLTHGYRPLVLGGGHEIAYGHFLGLQQVTAQRQLGILNFDAHFDLRSYAQQASSGTPFLQIADALQAQEKPFRYKVLGLQEHANTRILFQTADELQVRYTYAKDVQAHRVGQLKQELQEYLEEVDQVYVTVDLDVFAGAYAPGVSAVNALGLQPEVVLELLQYVAQSGKLLSLDIAELNPAFDTDNRTAKLGAALLYKVVREWQKV
ncbi:formimidoylglutamase [Pontibacter akesuensis]|uniref:Formimidoylglutamase n=1 Tax=Pontibacter akesuensis TaxID=388950 RepID=A0A1I7GRD2_9BACT|nr:formimidoylglutamase [Pontibacter akesuensis]GHA55506.1 formimidoylglutamase [Pontibacter akesuensis]SFU50911.1 formiminoglutamase [Pontibacter akesuensis]